ncbi:MAG: hypothetical protein ISS77_01865 [Phycisphaerae bacterium]|nr:hypothetical protein [Phycisphaerae bacterium]
MKLIWVLVAVCIVFSWHAIGADGTPNAIAPNLICKEAKDIPLPEHPRPDLQRELWKNLNGSWAFDFDPEDKGVSEKWAIKGNHSFTREIVVPFPWQSKLSGIDNQ